MLYFTSLSDAFAILIFSFALLCQAIAVRLAAMLCPCPATPRCAVPLPCHASHYHAFATPHLLFIAATLLWSANPLQFGHRYSLPSRGYAFPSLPFAPPCLCRAAPCHSTSVLSLRHSRLRFTLSITVRSRYDAIQCPAFTPDRRAILCPSFASLCHTPHRLCKSLQFPLPCYS